MKLTEDKQAFYNAMLDTPFGAPCVKKRGKDLKALVADRCGHGILVTPAITCDMLKGHPEGRLSQLVNATNPPEVMVRGHYHKGMEQVMAHFVWTGTVREFNETWWVD